MEQKMENVALKDFADVDVFNSRHDGYRRAGLTLAKGKNEFTGLSTDQVVMLQTDPALTVVLRREKLNKESDNHGGSDSSLNDNDQTLTVIFQKDRLNEKSDNRGSSNSGSGDNSADLDEDETSGENEGAGDTDADGDESNAKTPATPQLPVELSQLALAALADPDRLVYFNLDGSPRIATWREMTGLATLDKETVIKAIEAAVPTDADTGEGE